MSTPLNDGTVTVDDLAGASSPVLIDVRTPSEFVEAHVDGAILIPLDELAERAGEVPDANPVYVICHLGGRSARGAALLRQRGIDAVSVDGGTSAWIESGRAVVAGA